VVSIDRPSEGGSAYENQPDRPHLVGDERRTYFGRVECVSPIPASTSREEDAAQL